MFFGALVMPVTNALMSHRIETNAQGELQGAVASLFSLSSIVAPPFLTQIFNYFSQPTAVVHLPGAAFVAAATLALISLVMYARATRVEVTERVASAPAAA